MQINESPTRDGGIVAIATDITALKNAEQAAEDAKARLAALVETTDGFVIADRDLALRGPGELLGTRQAGAAQFRIADLVRDADLLEEVQRAAPSVMLPTTVRHGTSRSFCSMYPTLPAVRVTSRPSISTRPSSGGSRPETMLKSVDLPQPDGPTSTTNSPSAMSIDTP